MTMTSQQKQIGIYIIIGLVILIVLGLVIRQFSAGKRAEARQNGRTDRSAQRNDRKAAKDTQKYELKAEKLDRKQDRKDCKVQCKGLWFWKKAQCRSACLAEA